MNSLYCSNVVDDSGPPLNSYRSGPLRSRRPYTQQPTDNNRSSRRPYTQQPTYNNRSSRRPYTQQPTYNNRSSRRPYTQPSTYNNNRSLEGTVIIEETYDYYWTQPTYNRSLEGTVIIYDYYWIQPTYNRSLEEDTVIIEETYDYYWTLPYDYYWTLPCYYYWTQPTYNRSLEEDMVIIEETYDYYWPNTSHSDNYQPTYEENLELEERMGRVGSRLSEETIMGHLKVRSYDATGRRMDEEADICVICQSEYEKGEFIGGLQCRHEYHVECVKKWLQQHNSCPICKAAAVSPAKC